MVHESILSEWCRSVDEAVARHEGHPSPEDIAAATAEIRRGWSDEEHAKRLRPDWRRREWEIPDGGPEGEAAHSWLMG